MGELTRGMLVVDRREDDTAYPLGTNRSEAQREKGQDDTKFSKIDIATGLVQDPGTLGVVCMYETPGPSKLLALLLKRVWGCS